MRKFISMISFLLNSIYFMPFSYGQDEPTTFDEIGHQLQKQACSAGGHRFNELAFGVTDESNSIIKGLIKEHGTLQAQEGSVHKGEVAIFSTVFVCDGKISYCCLDSSHGTQVIKRANKGHIGDLLPNPCVNVKRIADDSLESSHGRYDIIKSRTTYNVFEMSPEVYEIITKITENMVAHTNKKYMKMWFSFFNDYSESRHALSWHMDASTHTVEDPEFIALAVLDVTLPTDTTATTPSKLKLGSINEKYEALYCSNRPQMREPPQYGVPIMEWVYIHKYDDTPFCSIVTPDTDCFVQPLIELKNCTGTGYIIDQSMPREDGTKIVHSRDVRPYNADRVSMIIRCYCRDDADEMMGDPEYREIKKFWDENMYISVPSREECKKIAASNLEKLTIPSSGL
ncbi:MAG: hypothetical protein QS748_02190 [Candidatus Endonucleobacter bathymodioli]|uniref:Uncharacterized protein n=1 Tax=Candidatus Endonucleibacter bathymodioli TaxID=539814 RepID=A0AA90NTS3_9GAMM|nr:hypothetical protein [Candidatus Endonucleobacter bathymodioli]